MVPVTGSMTVILVEPGAGARRSDRLPVGAAPRANPDLARAR
ncbi:hypothetical protein APASM_1528 [Actinosynnema pretiosum subsp. pretiosum]|nr:hypothetical protein APASM_1528 [Actinosynnema pretiosum subsp. pretiosum]